MALKIVDATSAMLPDILKIEQGSFDDPWTEGMLREELSNERAVFLAALDGAALCGFCIAHIVLDECELYDIASAPENRRLGVGKALLARLLDDAKGRGAAAVYLEVRSKNAGAIALYEKAGFIKTGLRRGYYESPKDDAILMTLGLESEEKC